MRVHRVGPLMIPAAAVTAALEGVQQTDRFRPASLQYGIMLTGGKVVPGRLEQECLCLNICSRASRSDEPGAGHPVMVCIHAGAFLLGNVNFFDGGALGASGEIVLVTINYRLGVFGSVDVGTVLGNARAPGNAGLRDMIEALRWLRETIAGFGSDSGRVTAA
jgi:carboxylesterase type B